MKSKHFLGLLALLLVTACGERMSWPKGTHKAEKKWNALDAHDYSYSYIKNCFCTEDFYPVKVVVRADTISDVLDPITELAVMDSTSTQTVLQSHSQSFHTVAQFFSLVEKKFNRANGEFEVSFDEEMGYPTYIDVTDKTGGDAWATYQIYDLILE